MYKLFLSKHKLNSFLNNAISAGSAALSAQLIHQVLPQTNVDIMVISSFMLLVPGLAITNAIRDTIAGDYVSGVARAADAFMRSCYCGRCWFCDVFLDIGNGNMVYVILKSGISSFLASLGFGFFSISKEEIYG